MVLWLLLTSQALHTFLLIFVLLNTRFLINKDFRLNLLFYLFLFVRIWSERSSRGCALFKFSSFYLRIFLIHFVTRFICLTIFLLFNAFRVLDRSLYFGCLLLLTTQLLIRNILLNLRLFMGILRHQSLSDVCCLAVGKIGFGFLIL